MDGLGFCTGKFSAGSDILSDLMRFRYSAFEGYAFLWTGCAGESQGT